MEMRLDMIKTVGETFRLKASRYKSDDIHNSPVFLKKDGRLVLTIWTEPTGVGVTHVFMEQNGTITRVGSNLEAHLTEIMQRSMNRYTSTTKLEEAITATEKRTLAKRRRNADAFLRKTNSVPTSIPQQ